MKKSLSYLGFGILPFLHFRFQLTSESLELLLSADCALLKLLSLSLFFSERTSRIGGLKHRSVK